MKKFFSGILFLIALVLSLVLIFSYFLSFVSPEKIGILVFIWFAFPYLWFCTLLSSIVYMFMKQWCSVFLFVTALAATWFGFTSVVNYNFSQEEKDGEIRIMSFNVKSFQGPSETASFNYEGFVAFIERESPDIICFQEMQTFNNVILQKNNNSIRSILKDYKYVISQEDAYGKSAFNKGLLVISRYPIRTLEKSMLEKTELPTSECLAVEVTYNEKQFILIDCHLESIRLTNNQLEVVNEVKRANLTDKTKENIAVTKNKMTHAFLARARQVDELYKSIQKFKKPIVICGDFNDTPISYTYQVLTRKLSDAFMTSCEGWGNTYNGSLPPLRIDHMLYSDGVEMCNYKIHKVDYSDHFPISAELILE